MISMGSHHPDSGPGCFQQLTRSTATVSVRRSSSLLDFVVVVVVVVVVDGGGGGGGGGGVALLEAASRCAKVVTNGQ